MRDIRRLKRECVGANGMYVDLSRNEIFPLTTEEIYYLRKLHNDPTLARNVVIKVEKAQPKTNVYEEQRSNEEQRRQQEYRRQEEIKRQQDNARRQQNLRNQQANSRSNHNKRRPQYKVSRQQPHVGSKHNLAKQLKKELLVLLVVSGISVSCIVGGNLYNSIRNENEPSDRVNYQTMVDDSDIGIIITDNYQTETNYADSETVEVKEIQNRRELIKDLCNIYQLNYEMVYNFLEMKTDHFSNPGYLEGCMPDVTCKGMQVYAQSEEEMLVYMIRIIKQDPARWNIDTSNLFINNGYTSGTDYCEQIEHVSEVLGVDKYLMYAIVQSECGFNSELFNYSNNPAGIMGDNGQWWKFDTKEEGFYELGMEIIKYYNWINEPLNDLSPDVIAKIRDIHAPLSDNNDNWLPNVLNRIEYAQNNSEELFGESSKGLSH